eukprot:1178395-Prorocentrum_minimum.AAC.5
MSQILYTLVTTVQPDLQSVDSAEAPGRLHLTILPPPYGPLQVCSDINKPNGQYKLRPDRAARPPYRPTLPPLWSTAGVLGHQQAQRAVRAPAGPRGGALVRVHAAGAQDRRHRQGNGRPDFHAGQRRFYV